MGSLDERRSAAVLGAAVADAAVQGLHWIYNIDKLDNLISQKKDIAFWQPSANPFYCLPKGKQSCYGDQAYVILKSLLENRGLDVASLKKDTYTFFGPDSPYESPVNATYKDKSDAKKTTFPIQGPWRHFSIKEFLVNYKEGKDETGSPTDEQIDGVVRIVPVVAMYAGQPDMLDKAEEVIRVTQESDFTVVISLCAARILEHYILNGPCNDAVEAVIKQLEDPNRNNPQDLDRAVASQLREVLKGRETDHRVLPGSFQLAVHGVITHSEYAAGVEATIRAGGCNCSRAGFIGACLAAQNGTGAIPDAWKENTLRYQENVNLMKQLCQLKLQ